MLGTERGRRQHHLEEPGEPETPPGATVETRFLSSYDPGLAGRGFCWCWLGPAGCLDLPSMWWPSSLGSQEGSPNVQVLLVSADVPVAKASHKAEPCIHPQGAEPGATGAGRVIPDTALGQSTLQALRGLARDAGGSDGGYRPLPGSEGRTSTRAAARRGVREATQTAREG